MSTIAALGPAHTFSEMAAKAFAERATPAPSIRLFPTIKKVFSAVGTECDLGVLPIENMVDGYVQPVLDLLLHGRLTITGEIVLPVRLAFFARCESLNDVKRVYAHPWAQSQCSEIIDSMPDVEVASTRNDGESFDRAMAGDRREGAIVPFFMLEGQTLPVVVPNVSDYEGNTTRFIALSDQEPEYREREDYKTSVVILEGVDRPGMLSDILAAFSKRSINLASIMSRPTKRTLGKYHFFVDVHGHASMPHIKEALGEVRRCGHVRVLGSYPRAQAPAAPSVPVPSEQKRWKETPFPVDRARPRVFVASGGDPYRTARAALRNVDLGVVKGLRVLVKPNIGRVAAPGSGIVAHRDVVAAAIDALKEAGAEIAVGDSPITGVRMSEAFEASGIGQVARERGCTLIDMDDKEPVELSIEHGTAIHSLTVCADALDYDVVVSVPVMKMHMHTGVSLAVKNMKGCLWGKSKVDLHMLPRIPYCGDKSLDVAIADMASVLRPHLSIIDGTVGMEGLGPSAGDPKPLGVVVVSVDPFAADSVACHLMGVRPENVPHLRLGAERGYGVIATGDLRITPDDWQTLASPFAPVPDNLSIAFPNVTILDENSCSACQSTVLLFLKRYGSELFDYFPANKPVSIALGKGHKTVPVNTLCVGNCTRPFRELGVYAPGCPPVASSILRSIKKNRGGNSAQ
jgi:prephenate dehydratase